MFDLLSGDYRTTYDVDQGPNPEASFVEFGYNLLEQDNTPQLTQFVTTLILSF